MEVAYLVSLLFEFGSVLLRWKGMCVQLHVNKKEIKSLLDFIGECAVHSINFSEELKAVGVPHGVGTNHRLSEKLKTDIQEATTQLHEWDKDRNIIWRLVNCAERRQDVEYLCHKVKHAVQTNELMLSQSLQLHLFAKLNRIGSQLNRIEGRLPLRLHRREIALKTPDASGLSRRMTPPHSPGTVSLPSTPTRATSLAPLLCPVTPSYRNRNKKVTGNWGLGY